MKILSLITHPHVVPWKSFFIFGTQIKIFLMKTESFLTLDSNPTEIVLGPET